MKTYITYNPELDKIIIREDLNNIDYDKLCLTDKYGGRFFEVRVLDPIPDGVLLFEDPSYNYTTTSHDEWLIGEL